MILIFSAWCVVVCVVVGKPEIDKSVVVRRVVVVCVVGRTVLLQWYTSY